MPKGRRRLSSLLGVQIKDVGLICYGVQDMKRPLFIAVKVGLHSKEHL